MTASTPSGRAVAAPTSASTTPRPKIMVVVLENTDYAAALQQPFLASVAKRGALLTNFKAEARPSQPNYIALIAGSTYGVISDDNVTIDARQIGDLLDARSLRWKVYAEGYPGNCFLGARDGLYVRKHVPFLSFKAVQQDRDRCARIVDAAELANDLKDGTLADFSLYIPDIHNDGHDTGVAYADRWMSAVFGPVLQDANLMNSLLFVVTFDESKSTLFGGNHVATIIVGDGVRPGAILTGGYNHYSLLRFVEDELGLGTLGQQDEKARPITGLK